MDVLGPSPTKPTKCKPLKASCLKITPRCRARRGRRENSSPEKTFVSQEVLSVLHFFDFVGPGPTGSGFLRGARLLSHFHGICIAAPFQHCSRAAFARHRASQNRTNFRSADGQSNAMTLEVMRFPGASGAFGRRGHSSSDYNPRRCVWEWLPRWRPQCSGIRTREARCQELRLRLAQSLRGGEAQEGRRHARLGWIF